MNKLREIYLRQKEEQAKELFEKIKENPQPDVYDLWTLSEEYFIEWRKLHDFPKLLNHFNKKLLLFKEWKQDCNFSDKQIIKTGTLSPFLEHKKLSKNKKLYYVKQIYDNKESFIVSYQKLTGTKVDLGRKFKFETIFEFYSYKDWLKQRNKSQEILYINSRNSPESEFERVFIHKDIYDTSSNDFELLKMGGIRMPVDEYGILKRGKKLEFVNLCGLQLHGEIYFGEEGNLSCSYCACDNMVADNLKIALLDFEHCSISNFNIKNSKIQQWRFYNCNVAGEFENSQVRNVTIWGGSFFPVIKNSTIFDVHIGKDKSIPDTNLYAYKLLKKLYADQGDDVNAIKYFTEEHDFIRKKSSGIKKLSKTISFLYWGYSRKPKRIILISILTLFLFAVLYWFNRELIILNNGNFVSLSFWDCIYFSSTTLTTLGYGDYSPIGFLRIAAILESFFGVLNAGFLVVGLSSNKY